MTYQQTIDYLYQLRLHGMKLGLETMRALMADISNPHERLCFIHVAGTNGKGSVCAMLASVFRTAGYRTALYTSPHLVSFCERFQINGELISQADVVRLVEEIRPSIERVARHSDLRCPTFFEVVTAMAAKYFAEQKADIVVWETGMGGRLDATNVVTPLVSVITEIGLDHVQYLGGTITAIAGEKAGIIKPGIPVVVNTENAEAFHTIRAKARERQSPLVAANAVVRATAQSESLRGQTLLASTQQCDYGPLWLPLIGENQIKNCATTLAVLEVLRDLGIVISAETVREGLARTSWPGRFQAIEGQPTFILDGAHNPQAAAVLRETLAKLLAGCPLTLVLGILKDKDCAAMCQTLAPLGQKILVVPVNSERTEKPQTLAELCRKANPSAEVRVMPSVAAAMAEAKQHLDNVVVVTGSLFLVGEAMQYLGKEPRFKDVTQKEMTLQ